MDFAGIVVDQVADQNGLETAHVDFAVVAMLDVSEIRSIAAPMVRMAVGSAWTRVSRALAFRHADTLHIEVGDVLRHCLRLVGRARDPGKHRRRNEQANNS